MNTCTYQIHILNVADLVGLDSSFLMRAYKFGEKNTTPTYSFLITGENIPPILVDTGVKEYWAEHTECFEPYHMVADIHKYDEQLAKLGYKREDIKVILHTHCHIDHAGNDDLFPNARIIINRKELMWSVAGIDPGYPAEYITYLVEQLSVPGKLRLFDDEFELFPGIVLQPTTGHTWGSTNIKVNTAKGVAVMCGDVIYSYKGQCVENDCVPDVAGQFNSVADAFGDWPTGNCWNWWEEIKAIQKINREADIILPSHDPMVLEKYGNLI